MTPETVVISRETAELALLRLNVRRDTVSQQYVETATRQAVSSGLGASEWKSFMPFEYHALDAAITDLKRALAWEE